MKLKYTPTLRISFALMAMTVNFIFFAYLLGLIPDENKIRNETRAKIAQTIAIQVADALRTANNSLVPELIGALRNEKGDVLSAAVRRADGQIMAVSEGHDKAWADITTDVSTPTHIQLPLDVNGEKWGRVELTFVDKEVNVWPLEIPLALIKFVGFIAVTSLIAYWLILKRTLKALHPSKVIPRRIHTAFDTLEDGVIVLDKSENILLANEAICSSIGKRKDDLIGENINSLNFSLSDDNDAGRGLPWRNALEKKSSIPSASMELRNKGSETLSYNVNANCILSEDNKLTGVIVSFNNVTLLKRKNEDLLRANNDLILKEQEIRKKNEELIYLADHDPLSGCMNRRAFFAKLDQYQERALTENKTLSCMMVDLDHFKSINDRFGHAVGDDAIVGVAKILRAACGDSHIVGRYGGEEYCVALFDLDEWESRAFAEAVRFEISQVSPNWTPNKEAVTASLGISMFPTEKCAATDVVDQADQALYVAKEQGRNRCIMWSPSLQAEQAELAG